MPGGREPDGWEGDSSSKLSLWQRVLLVLPRSGSGREKAPFSDRLRNAFLKPPKAGTDTNERQAVKPTAMPDLESEVRYADDKERLFGLIGAPLAAAIGILVIGALISNDPPALLKNGQVDKLHVNVTIYHDLTAVLLALSVLMLATAWFRRRLYLGIVMALYGLAIFNLHYWGFGVPFVMVGAWLLVRSYRLQRDLREATGGQRAGGQRSGGQRSNGQRSNGQRSNGAGRRTAPQRNKRYTPRSTPKRPPLSKPGDEKRAG